MVSSGVQEYLRTKEEGGEESKGDSSNEPDDAYYFDSYSRLGIHEEMLKDAVSGHLPTISIHTRA